MIRIDYHPAGKHSPVVKTVELRHGGDLPDLPDEPGVYIIVCVFPGQSSHRLGDVLYLGASNSLRRRVAYALAAPGKSSPHGIQEPLVKFQARGGIAKVIYCLLDEAVSERQLELAMMKEYEKRTGNLPKWNRSKARKADTSPEIQRAAAEILDRMAVEAISRDIIPPKDG